MKKVFVVALAVVALSVASCGGNKTSEASIVNDTTGITETSQANVAAQTVFQQLKQAANDPARLSLALGSAQAKIQQLLQSGDNNAVKEFTSILQGLIKGDTSVSDALAKAKTAVSGTNLLDAFNTIVGEATKEGATAAGLMEVAKKVGTNSFTDQAIKAGALSDSIATTASEKLEEAKDAAAAAVDNAKEAATGAVEGAKQQAAEKVEATKDAVNKKVEASKEAANKKIDEGAKKAADGLKKGLGL